MDDVEGPAARPPQERGSSPRQQTLVRPASPGGRWTPNNDRKKSEVPRGYCGPAPNIHIDMITKKASRSEAALARLMPNVRGPCQWKRRLLALVVESQLYADPVWATKVADIARTKANLIPSQRTAVLRVIRAYRTVYDEASLILADMPPADQDKGSARSRSQQW